jgi:hypothetical protein
MFVRPVGDAETRHDLDELGGVAAYLNEVLQFLIGDQVGFLGAVHRSHLVDLAGDLDGFRVVPTVSLASILRFSPPAKVIPVTLKVVKPFASIAEFVPPAGTDAKVK